MAKANHHKGDFNARDYSREYFETLTSIGGFVDFSGSSITDLGQLTSIGGNAHFRGSSITDLGQLTSIGGSAYFKGSSITDLGQLTRIGGSAHFRGSSITDLGQLTSIGGFVDFCGTSITDLGQLTSIGGFVDFCGTSTTDLGQLTRIGGSAPFRGDRVTILGTVYDCECVDGITTVAHKWRKCRGGRVTKALYLCGDLTNMKPCSIAYIDGHYGHGKTHKEAKLAARIKACPCVYDADDLRAEIKRAGVITAEHFHTVTGACLEGMRHHLEARGIDLSKVQSLPVDDALAAMSGSSFGDRFKAFYEASE